MISGSGQRELTVVTRSQGNNHDLKAGLVETPGYRLRFEEVPVLVDGFRRMVRELAYDVCEMAVTTYMCAKEHGVRFTAIPVFLVRGFHHEAIVTGGGRDVGALGGGRVGVQRGYTVTTGVWARGILADEYGIDLDGITWACTGDEHVEAYTAPPNVERLPAGSVLADLVADGELAGAVGLQAEPPRTTSAVADPHGVAVAAFRERGFYPINHLIVVRDDVLEAHPDLAQVLFEAFRSSKQAYVGRLSAGPEPRDEADRLNAELISMGMADPLPYGIEANRPVLETLIRYAVAQKIIRRRPALEELFHPSTWSLVG